MGEKHANDDYNDPGASGPGPMAPVFPETLDAANGVPSVDGGSVSGGGDPDAGARTAAYDGTLDGKAYADTSPEALQAEVDRRGIGDSVTGTGANGNVVKADLVKALDADDAARRS